ncbi:NACHT domain-containing protein [Frigoribacterium sp. CFBP 8754]|uniref:NACHT domain-containing protein n=1 Tax=Frigoribacterium sp. CFBP 8754 TaxID=2775290 RepID=UPI00177BD41D|nr:NACHT domain-containing protein [Frigoribacterium sp. CFBP 8754]MBD8660152.1 NACHT domain-containing protein [Frigoribacterium sp. CFBP 8754]
MGRSPESRAEDEAFEQEVLRSARMIFAPHRPHQGATFVAGRERDAVIEGDDVVVAIEATTSRTLEKAEKDGKKLEEMCERLAAQHKFKAVKGYFVTRDDPTAQQRDAINALHGPIVSCSLAQLRSQLIDSRDYLEARSQYPFGSARNPETNSTTELERYVPLGFISASSRTATGSTQSIGHIVEQVSAGKTVVVMGDFGAGKSMSLREVHNSLRKAHFRDSLAPFPVSLNLRDHQGQTETDEAIRRHASKLGFESPTKLVRAWRAGRVHLLLDGFDEIAASGWRGRTPDLKEIRRGSVELVRRFVEETPASAGLMITGRRHFFDSEAEMSTSLGLRDRRHELLYTDEFTDEQMQTYLSQQDWDGQLPDWLPNHPLLLGHLASAGALAVLADGGVPEAARGWEFLLEKICEREARIEHGMDGLTIRRVLERLASLARSRGSGQGPIRPADLSLAFEGVAGSPPDEGSYQVLQRLPGLGIEDATDGSRFFIDGSLLDAARAGDIVRYAHGQDDTLESNATAFVPLGRLGVQVATTQANALGLTGSQCNAAAKRLQARGGADALVLDLVTLSAELGVSKLGVLDFAMLEIPVFTLAEADTDFGSLTFHECIIGTLDLTEYDGELPVPHFDRCMIGTVLGAASATALPAGRFTSCDFEAFDPSSKTTRGILGMPGLRPAQKVLLTILKKVYIQSGGGRKESALVRGLAPEYKSLVSAVITHLISHQLLIETRSSGRTIYVPVRGNRNRVRSMLESPSTTQDAVMSGV